jgi:hypothetical protein
MIWNTKKGEKDEPATITAGKYRITNIEQGMSNHEEEGVTVGGSLSPVEYRF